MSKEQPLDNFPQPAPRTISRWRLIAPALFVLFGLPILAVAEPNGPNEYLAINYLFGTVFGHTTLAAAWTAFGPGRLIIRFPLTLLWLLFLIVLPTLALDGPGEGFGIFATCVFAPWAILQFPFTGLAVFYGLQLRRDILPGSARGPIQFGIRQFMIFTAAISVLLALGRFSIPMFAKLSTNSVDWQIFLFLVAASILMSLPLILAALLPRYSLPSVLVVLVLAGIATFSEVPLLEQVARGGPGGPDIWHFAGINAFTAAWIVVIAGLVRWSGYRFASCSTK